MPNVLLIGNGPTALTALQSLMETFPICGVFRESIDVDDEVTRLAHAAHIPVFLDTSLPNIHAKIRSARPDCAVVSSYNRILDAEILASCPFVNVHYAPLPRYRGRACVNWALINGEPFTAISIHELVPALDAGNLLFQQLVPIEEADTVGVLYERLNALQRIHLGTTVRQFLNGFRGRAQIQADASYGCTRLPADGLVAWDATTRVIDRLIRALTVPFPGAYTYLDGMRMIIWRAEVVRDAPTFDGRIPGRVTAINRTAGSVDVLTGDGILRLLEVEPEAGRRIEPASIIKSVRTTLGLGPAQLLERIEQLERQLRTVGTNPTSSAPSSNRQTLE